AATTGASSLYLVVTLRFTRLVRSTGCTERLNADAYWLTRLSSSGESTTGPADATGSETTGSVPVGVSSESLENIEKNPRLLSPSKFGSRYNPSSVITRSLSSADDNS